MSPVSAIAIGVSLTLSIFSTVLAVDPTRDPNLDASLFTAATQLDRMKLLSMDSDWLFDFNAQPSYTYSPGSVINTNTATFPALVGTGMTLAMLNLGPCAMLPPHYHPRATNLVIAIGGTTNTYMIQENGVRMVSEILVPGKTTVFPTASIHSMQNTDCGNATLVSALNSDDTGTQTILNGLYTLPFDIRLAADGIPAPSSAAYDFFKAYNVSNVPPIGTGSIIGSADCLTACQKKDVYTGP